MAFSIIPYEGDDRLRETEGWEDFIAHAVMPTIAVIQGIFFTPEEVRTIAKQMATRIVENDE